MYPLPNLHETNVRYLLNYLHNIFPTNANTGINSVIYLCLNRTLRAHVVIKFQCYNSNHQVPTETATRTRTVINPFINNTSNIDDEQKHHHQQQQHQQLKSNINNNN